MVDRTYGPGQRVIYRDHFGRDHDALTNEMWGDGKEGEPAVNLVYVSGDPEKRDSYGRQIERETSCPHRSRQTAPGNFWRWPDE